ncbi:MAG: prolipoprotein diacylglyceryl transferase [Bryobacterales bacterium]|nr:prolipoprotein diacylglyceryl transferase [Bryobacterales bacterium]
MLPYVEWTVFTVGPLRILVQPLLAGTGIVLTHLLLLRRTRQWGLDPGVAAWLSFSMALTGLCTAFAFRWLYLPGALARDPWIWLKTTAGASSFGGLAGGLLAAGVYLLVRRIPAPERWRYLDALATVFPSGWLLGRAGCALAHDHPGLRSTHWLAVRYPDAPRWDLGVLEVLFFLAVVLPAVTLLRPAARVWPPGRWLGWFLAVYGGFRVLLDRLHVDPPRYGAFTVDQWAYGAATLAGITLLLRVGVTSASATPAPPPSSTASAAAPRADTRGT